MSNNTVSQQKANGQAGKFGPLTHPEPDPADLDVPVEMSPALQELDDQCELDALRAGIISAVENVDGAMLCAVSDYVNEKWSPETGFSMSMDLNYDPDASGHSVEINVYKDNVRFGRFEDVAGLIGEDADTPEKVRDALCAYCDERLAEARKAFAEAP